DPLTRKPDGRRPGIPDRLPLFVSASIGSMIQYGNRGHLHEGPMKTSTQPTTPRRGITLIELLVVLVIITLLATIAAGSYTNQVRRAKIAATKAEIKTLEVAINRYQIDTGQFPVSFTGVVTPPPPNAVLVDEDPVNPTGSGYLQVTL